MRILILIFFIAIGQSYALAQGWADHGGQYVTKTKVKQLKLMFQSQANERYEIAAKTINSSGNFDMDKPSNLTWCTFFTCGEFENQRGAKDEKEEMLNCGGLYQYTLELAVFHKGDTMDIQIENINAKITEINAIRFQKGSYKIDATSKNDFWETPYQLNIKNWKIYAIREDN